MIQTVRVGYRLEAGEMTKNFQSDNASSPGIVLLAAS